MTLSWLTRNHHWFIEENRWWNGCSADPTNEFIIIFDSLAHFDTRHEADDNIEEEYGVKHNLKYLKSQGDIRIRLKKSFKWIMSNGGFFPQIWTEWAATYPSNSKRGGDCEIANRKRNDRQPSATTRWSRIEIRTILHHYKPVSTACLFFTNAFFLFLLNEPVVQKTKIIIDHG